MSKVLKLLNDVRKDEEGVTMVEYALLLGLISVVAIAAITAIGVAVNNKFSTACGSLGGTGC
jgi:pilus assembly protein Flp/PilA